MSQPFRFHARIPRFAALAAVLTFGLSLDLAHDACASEAGLSAPVNGRQDPPGAALPAGLTPGLDPASGALQRLRGSARVAAPIASKSAAVDAVRPLVERWTALLGADGFAWDLDFVGEAGGLYSVRFVPVLDGAPLEGASVRFTVASSGHLFHLDAHGLAPAPSRAVRTLAQGDAAELARIAPDGATPGAWCERPVPVLLREPGGVRAAWRVRVHDSAVDDGAWSVFVDGRTGEALRIVAEALGSVDGTARGRAKAAGSPTYGAPAMTPLSSLYVHGVIAGSGITRLTTNACVPSDIAISGDGARVVWAESCGADRDLWTALNDGTGLLRLTTSTAEDHSPTVSADGSSIVFVSDRDGNEELYRIGADGGGLTRLTFDPAADHSPSANADATAVAFVSNRSGNDDVWHLNLATLALTQVTTDPGSDVAPAMARETGEIALLSDRGGDTEVYLVSSLGAVPMPLTFDAFEQGPPTIADDGSRVLFASQALDPRGGGAALGGGAGSLGGMPLASAQRRTPRWSIWSAEVATGALARLTDTTSDEQHPAISGNGLRFAYVRQDAGGAATVAVQEIGSGIDIEVGETSPGETPALSSSGAEGAFVAPAGAGTVDAYAWSAIIAETDTTDAAGAFSLPLPAGSSASVSARLRGRWARVVDLAPQSPDERVGVTAPSPSAGVTLTFNATGALTLPEAQVTAYRAITSAHDFAAAALNGPRLVGASSAPIDAQVRVEVNGPSQVHNAFYFLGQDRIRTFRQRSPLEPNTAIPSVLYHEYGHYVDDRFGGALRFNADEHPFGVTEGVADAVALVGLDTTSVGLDWDGPGTVLRDYLVGIHDANHGARDRHYDCTGCTTAAGQPEPHDHGQALANFVLRLAEVLPSEVDELVLGVIGLNPGSMQEFVDLTAALAGTPGFCPACPTGDVAEFEPLYLAVCRAAASAGFQCPGRPDFGSQLCFVGECPGNPAAHFSTGTEWLGAVVFGNDPGCGGGDDDGISFVDVPTGGEPVEIDVTLSVAPEQLSKGRYVRDAAGMGIDAHALYLNAWLFVDDGAGGFTETKVWGTGSGSPITGGLAVGALDTLAFDPNLWGSSSKTFRFFVDLPDVMDTTTAFLRLRLDYGEDAGRLTIPRSFPGLSGKCGVARFGEVEDHPFLIFHGGV